MTARENRQQLIFAELERIDGVAPGDGPLTDKHRKMAGSPLQFLRGTAQIFYADLSGSALALPDGLFKAPLTRISGDCHLCNFGFLTEEGSYGDTVIWAPNDHDDAAEAHAAFDLARFSVSLFLAADYLRGLTDGRYASDKRIGDGPPPGWKDAARAAGTFLKAYRKTCGRIVDDPDLRDQALDRFDKDHFLRKSLQKATTRAPGGRKFEKKSVVGKLAIATAAGYRFDPALEDLLPLDPALREDLELAFRPYLDDTILDVARRIGAGTGSLSVDRYYFLVGPRAAATPETFRETHVVEVKQQRAAALIHHFPELSPVNRMDPAHLTVDCQRRMMRRPDLVLDEVVWKGRHWLVRSRHHTRLNVDPEELLKADRPASALRDYAAACGATLARTHARGDRRSVRFERAMAKAVDKTGEALIGVARDYAGLVIADHALLRGQIGDRGTAHAV